MSKGSFSSEIMMRVMSDLGRALVLTALLLAIPFGGTANYALPAANLVFCPEPTEEDVVPVEQIHRIQQSHVERLRDQPRHGRRHQLCHTMFELRVHFTSQLMNVSHAGLSQLQSPLRC